MFDGPKSSRSWLARTSMALVRRSRRTWHYGQKNPGGEQCDEAPGLEHPSGLEALAARRTQRDMADGSGVARQPRRSWRSPRTLPPRRTPVRSPPLSLVSGSSLRPPIRLLPRRRLHSASRRCTVTDSVREPTFFRGNRTSTTGTSNKWNQKRKAPQQATHYHLSATASVCSHFAVRGGTPRCTYEPVFVQRS